MLNSTKTVEKLGKDSDRMRKTFLLVLVALAVALASASAASARRGATTINLVAYSTPKPVLAQIISAWQKTPDGNGVSVTQSYGASGAQTRAVLAGQPADVAFLATGVDMNSLADAGIVSSTWDKGRYAGIGADSVVAFLVREGNPKHIHTWSDLIKPGVQVVTPNPFTSGGAMWNILAAYGSERKLGKTDKQATSFVQQLFQHVVSQDTSSSNAANTYLSGKGDVLITYESEAYAAVAKGQGIHMVVPKQTLLVQLPLVATSKAPAQAQKFVSFVQSPAGQTILASNGYRPVDKSVLKDPSLAKWRLAYNGGSRLIVTIDDPIYGGWRKAFKTWFDPNNGRMVNIEHAVGGTTGG